MNAYNERRKRELFELGSVSASAHHDPQGLSALKPKPAEEESSGLFAKPLGS